MRHAPQLTDAEREAKVHEACGHIVEMFRSPETLPSKLAPIFLQCGTWMARWSVRNQLIAAFVGTADAMTIFNWKRYAGREPLEKFTGEAQKLGYVPGGFYILRPVKRQFWITIEDEETGRKTRVKRERIIGYTPHYVYPIEHTRVVDEALWAKWNERNEKARRIIEEMPFIDMLKAKGLSFRVENTASYGYLGYYDPREQVIAIGVANMATQFHEVGHFYDDACGNLTKGNGQDIGNEIVAEFFGATLLSMLGFEHEADLGGAWDYIRNYASRKEGNTSTVAILGAVNDLMWRVKAALTLFFQDVQDFEEAEKCTTSSKS